MAYADLSGSGSTNITTVGTITTGTWDAGAVTTTNFTAQPGSDGTCFSVNNASGTPKVSVDTSGHTVTVQYATTINNNLAVNFTCYCGVFYPLSGNSVTGMQFCNASGTSIINIDSTNQRVGVLNTSPTYKLDVTGGIRTTTGLVAPELLANADASVAMTLGAGGICSPTHLILPTS